MLRSESRLIYSPLPTDDPKRRKPNIARANSLLGWEPHVGLEQGLERTIDWFAREMAASVEAADEPFIQQLTAAE
jgi:UDP-glucuronate decarboxylase